jgi:hypothetical protein
VKADDSGLLRENERIYKNQPANRAWRNKEERKGGEVSEIEALPHWTSHCTFYWTTCQNLCFCDFF